LGVMVVGAVRASRRVRSNAPTGIMMVGMG